MFTAGLAKAEDVPLKNGNTPILFNFTTGIGTDQNPEFQLGCLYYATDWADAVFQLAWSFMQLKSEFDSGFNRPFPQGVCIEGGYAIGPWE